MRRTSIVAALAIALAGLAASCDHDTVSTGVPSETLEAQMAAVEIHADDALDSLLGHEIAAGESAPENGLTRDVTFSGTRQCPAGGEILWEGSLHWTYDFET